MTLTFQLPERKSGSEASDLCKYTLHTDHSTFIVSHVSELRQSVISFMSIVQMIRRFGTLLVVGKIQQSVSQTPF